jgi:hypothetical protein
MVAPDARSDRRNPAGDLEAGRRRGPGRGRIAALPLQHVRTIDAGGLDMDQDLAFAGRRHRQVGRDENVRAARLGDGDRRHGLWD